MPELLKIYPDMNFVWTHRDPLKAADSVVNMYGNCMWIRSDTPMIAGAFDQMINADFAAFLLNQPIEWMESGVIPKERVCNIRFLELENDPVAEIQKMYAQLGMTLTDKALRAMQQYMADNPRSARPPANYKSAANEKVQTERQAMKRYQDYFHVQSEF